MCTMPLHLDINSLEMHYIDTNYVSLDGLIPSRVRTWWQGQMHIA